MGRATQLGVNFAKRVLTNARLGVNFVPDIAPEPHISINLEVGPGKEADVTAQFKTIENFAQRSRFGASPATVRFPDTFAQGACFKVRQNQGLLVQPPPSP